MWEQSNNWFYGLTWLALLSAWLLLSLSISWAKSRLRALWMLKRWQYSFNLFLEKYSHFKRVKIWSTSSIACQETPSHRHPSAEQPHRAHVPSRFRHARHVCQQEGTGKRKWLLFNSNLVRLNFFRFNFFNWFQFFFSSVEEDVLAVPPGRRRQDEGRAALQVRGRPHRPRQADHETILPAETQVRGSNNSSNYD